MIGFAGLSHLGIVSSAATAAKGFSTLGYDRSNKLVENLSRGDYPIFEDGLDGLCEENKERLSYSSDINALAACDVIYISQDIPTNVDNESDYSVAELLFSDVLSVAKKEATIVVLCQVRPGFMRKLLDEHEQTISKNNIAVYYQVETLIFGQAVERALHPERFIVGCLNPDQPVRGVFAKLLAAFDCPILPMRYESAELSKIAINICLLSSLTTTNTLAEVCEEIGADWSEIAPALRLDKRIGPHAYLQPGLGVAGGNLERDLTSLHALANACGSDSGVLDSWVRNLEYRRDWVLRELHQKVFPKVEAPIIAVWGLAYKAGTDSIKNSPSLSLLEALSGYEVRTYDPQARSVSLGRDISRVDSALGACSGADVLVVMTPWDEFSEISVNDISSAMRGLEIIDPFTALPEEKCREIGFSYRTLGKGDE